MAALLIRYVLLLHGIQVCKMEATYRTKTLYGVTTQRTTTDIQYGQNTEFVQCS